MENRAIGQAHLRQWHIGAPEKPEPLPRVVEFVNMIRREARTAAVRLPKLLWGLDYHFEDAGEYSLDGVTWQPRERGTAHLYAPASCHWERASPRDVPFTETYFIFRADGIPVLNAIARKGEGFARFVDGSGLIGGAFAELLDTPERGRGYWQAQSTLYRVLSCLVSSKVQQDGEYLLSVAPPAGAMLSERVDAYLREHYHLRLTLDRIARSVGVSRSTLTHRYRNETGTTPMDRLSEFRLMVARSMILRGEPLKAIAAHTGFYDEFHFSNAFRQHFGLAPRQYARQAAAGNPDPRHVGRPEGAGARR